VVRPTTPENFFDVMRAMLFYIDEFPERLHHPKESNLLFPRVAKAVPHVMGTVDRLERDHMHSEKSVRDVQHLLLSWELLGDSRHGRRSPMRSNSMSTPTLSTCGSKKR
jgi:hemerythrin-like domain-containing protein